jgi:hypothetical protein
MLRLFIVIVECRSLGIMCIFQQISFSNEYHKYFVFLICWMDSRELYSGYFALRRRSSKDIDTVLNFARRHGVVYICTREFHMVCPHI